MRASVIGCGLLVAALGVPSSAVAAPLLLVHYDLTLTQITGCDGGCMGSGGNPLNGHGIMEMVLEANTNRVLAASPMFHVTEPYRDAPRFARFDGWLAQPSPDCELFPGEITPCFMMGIGSMTQLEGTSAGAWRDFVIEPWGWAAPDPIMGLVPQWFDTQEEGEINGRHVWFWGNASFRSITEVNSNLAPIPEPGSLTLWGIGAVAMWLRHRRRQG